MKLAIFGDVHCEWGHLNRTIFKALNEHSDITHLVQVGDLGYSWPRTQPFKMDRRMANTMVVKTPDEVFEKAKSIPFYWCEGNHENFDVLEMDQGASQLGMIYQSRGSIVEFSEPGISRRAMFFGGASSIDKPHRIPYISWWPQESITQAQVLAALEKQGPLDIVFSHEFPTTFQYRSWKDDFGMSDRNGLEAIRNHFKPKCWIFGHHHAFAQGNHDGTSWMCAPIIDDGNYIIWDGEELRFHQ